jgi:beta-galactosidase
MGRKKPSNDRVELVSEGIRVGRSVLPLLVGTVHYWRLEPETWRPALEAVKALGLRFVDTYVPWGVHERSAGEFDFGRTNSRLDVTRFLRIAEDVGLYVIARPGPHINAELTYFGIPERVIWIKECQAVSPGGHPVALPVPPLAFPVPSYASEAFHTEALVWLRAVGAELAPLVWPNGPIVLCQVDNEGAMYFRDGVYDQDYHSDAIAHYREFLREKYENVEALREVLGDPGATFFNVEPPRRLNATKPLELARHLDWAEFQEALLARAFERYKQGLASAGLTGIPTSHNLPLSEGATPLDPERVGEVVDLLGLDYYHGASPPQRAEIARRTSELAERSAHRGHPAFACELGAGFPPFFPPLSEGDNAFTALTALAYGLRGYNLYMAVERDRWIGAPVDTRGRLRASADFWQRLNRALEKVRFAELERRTEVHVVVPRSLRRLARVMHAFGPISAALFQVMGGGAQNACFEDDLGLGGPRAIEVDRFLAALEAALDEARIPYSFSGGDTLRHSLKHSRWTIVASSSALEPELVERVARARERGKSVTLGPYAPERDASFRPLDEPLVLPRTVRGSVPPLLPFDDAAIAEAVATAKRELELTPLASEPGDVRVTLHCDRRGTPRVLFAINATEHDIESHIDAVGARRAVDLLDHTEFRPRAGSFNVEIAPRSVRMFELST